MKFKEILCPYCLDKYTKYMSEIGKEGLKKRWKKSKKNVKVEALLTTK